MTDNEIIKALECCINNESGKCPKDCPLFNDNGCKNDLYALEKYALDLINRLKAENKELKRVIKNFRKSKQSYRTEIERLQRKNSELQHETLNCKTEAIREFAERLKEEIYELLRNTKYNNVLQILVKIDSLVKEMTEGSK